MKLLLWDELYAISRLLPDAPLPDWLPSRGFVSVTRTRDETSIVCLEPETPITVRAERGWRILQLEGPVAFSETGVVASLVAPLADGKISVFAVSTFDTDYLLVKEAQLAIAISALESAGHSLR